jgi:hypothetical protein
MDFLWKYQQVSCNTQRSKNPLSFPQIHRQYTPLFGTPILTFYARPPENSGRLTLRPQAQKKAHPMVCLFSRVCATKFSKIALFL